MATLKERKASQDAWQSFADRLGVELEDIRDRAGDGLLVKGKHKASVPVWLRDLVTEKTCWKTEPANVAKIGAA